MKAAKLSQLRQAIYKAVGVEGYSRSYRPKKLRQKCVATASMDLRKPGHVAKLAQYLGIRLNLSVVPAFDVVTAPNYGSRRVSFSRTMRANCPVILLLIDGIERFAFRCRRQVVPNVTVYQIWLASLPLDGQDAIAS